MKEDEEDLKLPPTVVLFPKSHEIIILFSKMYPFANDVFGPTNNCHLMEIKNL